ncbi:tyrosine-type recombinase/integrase [Methylorubrum sp. SL192]|nr:tyrosine-type recombinase/integrase [Methylorubrum sp. SL192]MCY1644596.1 tyrosine-type recombinase/integrase [Methylorubrum sp. SL192]
MQGQSVTLPIGDTWASITVGPIVQASLRTKEPREARHRHSIADGALKRFWHEQRFGTLPDLGFQRSDSAQANETPTPSPPVEALTRVEAISCATGLNPTSLSSQQLFERWATYSADKRARNTIKRYRATFRSLTAFFKERDVRCLSSDDLYEWAEWRRDHAGVSARSINRVDLVAVSSIFRWAGNRSGGRLLSSNPARGIFLDEPRLIVERERTFREAEIARILDAASAVVRDQLHPTRSAARRWCPWLAAYSGARIGELTSLEKRDIRLEAGISVMDLRITKTGEPRTVPLHAHLLEQGFVEFVNARSPGPLFYDRVRFRPNSETSPAEQQAKKISQWLRLTVKLDPGVDPNHGWRHTWKTRALAAGIEERLRDAITGHRVASVGRRYETPSLPMLSRAIAQFPHYEVNPSLAIKPF